MAVVHPPTAPSPQSEPSPSSSPKQSMIHRATTNQPPATWRAGREQEEIGEQPRTQVQQQPKGKGKNMSIRTEIDNLSPAGYPPGPQPAYLSGQPVTTPPPQGHEQYRGALQRDRPEPEECTPSLDWHNNRNNRVPPTIRTSGPMRKTNQNRPLLEGRQSSVSRSLPQHQPLYSNPRPRAPPNLGGHPGPHTPWPHCASLATRLPRWPYSHLNNCLKRTMAFDRLSSTLTDTKPNGLCRSMQQKGKV